MTTTISSTVSGWLARWLILGDTAATFVGDDTVTGVAGGSPFGGDFTWTDTGGGVVENADSPLFGQSSSDNQGFTGGTVETTFIDAMPGTVDPNVIGDYKEFPAGEMTVTFESANASLTIATYALDAISAWLAGDAALPSEDRYTALLDTTGTEVTGGSYARQPWALTAFPGSGPFGGAFEGMPAVTVRFVALFNANAAGDEILRFQVTDTPYGAGDTATANPSGAFDPFVPTDVVFGEP